ncbi:YaaC family protein [Bacillus massilinigeriensis]|uniref:YaaC family protein n=1 Tax=Bacillus mediterraneensis TaxID=1805474 RepID=UPI000A78AE6C|nr:YaaC family protein [Bacillus mediterraneensis]
MSLSYPNWNRFSFFFSGEYSQNYLKKSYLRLGIQNVAQLSYQNCYPFMYYLEHGKMYYSQAAQSPLPLKPILLYYGLIHLIKACILTVEPYYPETTSVLAHGVSARKRKKQHYSFFEDEVKFQKHGLFPFMAEKLFHMKQLEGEKVSMAELLQNIPELSSLFAKLKGKHTFISLKKKGTRFTIPNAVLDSYHMTEGRFQAFYTAKSAVPVQFHQDGSDDNLHFTLDVPDWKDPLPLKYDLHEECYAIPLIKEPFLLMPELLLHYLLLYNLGMIARYETEWWSELIRTMASDDYPFIQLFLDLSLEKGPYLISRLLNPERISSE